MKNKENRLNREIVNRDFKMLSLVQTSNFSCAKSNANEQNPLFELPHLHYIRHMKSSTFELDVKAADFHSAFFLSRARLSSFVF